MDDGYESKTITFELDTENPRKLIFTIICEQADLDGEDLLSALRKLLEMLEQDEKNARARELAGH